jgi:hypothetical protein
MASGNKTLLFVGGAVGAWFAKRALDRLTVPAQDENGPGSSSRREAPDEEEQSPRPNTRRRRRRR